MPFNDLASAHRSTSPLGEIGSRTDSGPSHDETERRVESTRMPGAHQFEELRPQSPSGSRLSRRLQANARMSTTHDAGRPDTPSSDGMATPRIHSPLLHAPTPRRIHSAAAQGRQAYVEDGDDTSSDASMNFAHARATGYTALPTDSRAPSPFFTREPSPSAPAGGRAPVDGIQWHHDDWDRRTPTPATSHTSHTSHTSNTTHTSLPQTDANWSDYTNNPNPLPFNATNATNANPFQRAQRMGGANRARDPMTQRFRPWQNMMQGGFGIASMLAETFINVVQSIAQIFEKWGEALVSLTRR